MNSNKSVTIIGEAWNSKGGAVVISRDDKEAYFLDGIDGWDQKMVGKVVKVTGELLVEYHPPQKKGEEIAQDMEGNKNIILKPKWEIIK